jgi:hypothetical protein
MVEPVVPGRHRWLAGLLGGRPGDRVVDLGCGTGASLVQVAPDIGGEGRWGSRSASTPARPSCAMPPRR